MMPSLQPASPTTVRGAAYTPFFRALASVVVFGLIGWLCLLPAGPAALFQSGPASGWYLAVLAMMVWTWWSILRSETWLGPDGLHQRWIWHKHVALSDLADGRLLRVRGLEWLIAPRFYARAGLGKFTVFYLGTPELVTACEALAQQLKAR